MNPNPVVNLNPGINPNPGVKLNPGVTMVVQVGGVKAELQERLRQHLSHPPSAAAQTSPPPASTKLDFAHENEEEEEDKEAEEEEEGAFSAVTQMSQETEVSQESDDVTRVRGRDLPTRTPAVTSDADGGAVPKVDLKVLKVGSGGSRLMVLLSVAVSVMLLVAVMLSVAVSDGAMSVSVSLYIVFVQKRPTIVSKETY